MPVDFDKLKTKIWGSIKGKKNPKTKKSFTESDAYAIATAQWKKTHGGKSPTESVKDWRVMEYFMPITEAVNSKNDFVIRGVAINETTTRNGITYTASELEPAAPSFRNKPIMVDHSGSVKDIVGRTTENVNFNSITKAIEFEGKIMDSKIKEMINDGRITDVSIGAKVRDLVKNEKDGSITAVGLEGLEISVVACPGDPGANIANALSDSFQLKESVDMAETYLQEMEMNGEEVDFGNEEIDTELNNEKEDNMEEAEKEKTVEQTETVKTEEVKTETVKVDMTEVNKSISALTEIVGNLAKKVAEQEAPAPSVKEEEEISKSPVEDETVGNVGGEEPSEPAETEEGFVVEKADVGKGFQIYRDYSKTSGKFNRLCR